MSRVQSEREKGYARYRGLIKRRGINENAEKRVRGALDRDQEYTRSRVVKISFCQEWGRLRRWLCGVRGSRGIRRTLLGACPSSFWRVRGTRFARF